jgi:hypothetical protein
VWSGEKYCLLLLHVAWLLGCFAHVIILREAEGTLKNNYIHLDGPFL